MKKHLLIAVASLLAVSAAHASTYDVDSSHSSVGFSVRHLVSKVNGSFKDFSGTINFDPKKATASSAEFTVKIASIDTQNEKRDGHLKSPDFFDTEKFPTMTFKSKKVIAAGKDKYKLIGELTMHGVTREETFVVEYGGNAKDPWGNNRAGFSATTTLNRKNYGIIWNKTLDTGAVMLGDDVAVNLSIEAIEKAAAPAAKH